MNHAFPGNSMINISNARIDGISSESGTILITVSYLDCVICKNTRQTIRLVVSDNTLIFDEHGNIISVGTLRVGMIVNATISSAMTRSIPPQAQAFIMKLVRRGASNNTTTGRIKEIDRQNRSFTV